jgi:hypothetical protein
MISRLDSWQKRVFLLEGDIRDEKWHDLKTDLDFHVRGGLMQLSKKGIPTNTRIVLEDDQKIVLRGMYHRETTRHSLERAMVISYMGPPVYTGTSIRAVLLSYIRRMDMTKRCLRMLQRYPEGLANWMAAPASPNKRWFRLLVAEMYLEGSGDVT